MSGKRKPRPRLTETEIRQIIELARAGRNCRQIADEIGRSVRTVHNARAQWKHGRWDGRGW
jgi:transposase